MSPSALAFDGAFDQTISGNHSDRSVGVQMEIPRSNVLCLA
ncbi:MAG: hypothetical protein Q8N35_01490 [Methylococcaceae bacterium]|nr:hypothetical protein [Methylococcaceae bacterium]MDZ4155630.1 hypothetical protein [Methylococcales bacterium]MDP2392234.1 hypothetical protein [Methylococcaceae bacterium]MDP3018236.1 hypothetical protein [Methylococcaceae bacterium]MDP3389879.1 hypothetical protein [Methylococcaceae bacterium]